MSRHYDAEVLARYREDLVSQRRASRISRHLSECATCTRVDSGLASVSAVLAATPTPVMPEQFAERLQLAIATESAARVSGSGTVADGPAEAADAGSAVPVPVPVPGRPDIPARSARRRRRLRMPDLSSPLVLRALAATGAVVIIAGAGFLLARGQSGTSGPTSGAAAPTRAARVPAPGENVARSAATTSVDYRRHGVAATAAVSTSRFNYTSANLASQVRKQVASTGPGIFSAEPSAAASAAPSGVPGPTSPTAGKATVVSGFSVPQLQACLTRLAAGRIVLLVDIARYRGKPAAIVILQAPSANDFDVVVAGLSCSSSVSDIITQARVPRVQG